MKTDRELLELAAKAARLRISIRLSNDGIMVCSAVRKSPHKWNPLTDDGDALRLAVSLRLPIHYRVTNCWGEDEKSTVCGMLTNPSNSEKYENKVAHKGDAYAATRRAVVLAAAAIGETL